MAAVELVLAALPSHVRTARLVAAALGRRAGLTEAILDDVRLAVGEATSRAVGLHGTVCPQDSIIVRFVDDDGGQFVVEVVDRAPLAAPPTGAQAHDLALAALAAHGDELEKTQGGALPPSIGLAVIEGLVDDVSIRPEGPGSVIRLGWSKPVTNQSTNRPVSRSGPSSA